MGSCMPPYANAADYNSQSQYYYRRNHTPLFASWNWYTRFDRNEDALDFVIELPRNLRPYVRDRQG
jgi:hypothetical protein